MAPYQAISLRDNTCDSGYQWYTCNIQGLSYAGCCSMDPCNSVTFCPPEDQELTAPDLPEQTADPPSTTQTWPTESPYPTTTATSSASSWAPTDNSLVYPPKETAPPTSDPTSQTGNAIAATVGALVGIGFIAACLWLFRYRRGAKEEEKRAREEEKRAKKEKRKGIYGSPGSSSGSSSAGSRRKRSITQIFKIPEYPSRHDNASTEAVINGHSGRRTDYSVHIPPSAPAPPYLAQHAAWDDYRDYRPTAYRCIVSPESWKSSRVYRDEDPTFVRQTKRAPAYWGSTVSDESQHSSKRSTGRDRGAYRYT